MVTEIKLPDHLLSLVMACEKTCQAECCGIDAFDLSPLHMASHLSTYSGKISEADITAIEQSLDDLLEQATQLQADDNGFICSVEGTNQLFTPISFESLVEEIRQAVRLAPKVFQYARDLQRQEPCYQSLLDAGGTAPEIPHRWRTCGAQGL